MPINLLVQVEGTPLADAETFDPFEFVRTIAVARITMPASMVRLSAGREDMSDEMQALCFLAGANSIFYGPKLLTTPNPGRDRDMRLLDKLGMVPMDTWPMASAAERPPILRPPHPSSARLCGSDIRVAPCTRHDCRSASRRIAAPAPSPA